jgi:hypothetical protein
MKYIIIATTLAYLISGAGVGAAANAADRNSDTEIQNLRHSAKMAYSNADAADAQGDHAGAARWRQKAHDFETQVQNLHLQDQNVDDAANAIAGAFSSN